MNTIRVKKRRREYMADMFRAISRAPRVKTMALQSTMLANTTKYRKQSETGNSTPWMQFAQSVP